MAHPLWIVLLASVLLLGAGIASAGVDWSPWWHEVFIAVQPNAPTEATPVTLDVWGWFPDSGYVLGGSRVSVQGKHIEAEIWVNDIHQEGYGYLTVITHVGESFGLGPLMAGLYTVDATMYISGCDWHPPAIARNRAWFTVSPSEAPPWHWNRLDLNGDGVISTDDLAILLGNWGQSGEHVVWTMGDINGDGMVNTDDLSLMIYPDTWGIRGMAGLSVPEPTTLALLGAGLLGLHRRRR